MVRQVLSSLLHLQGDKECSDYQHESAPQTHLPNVCRLIDSHSHRFRHDDLCYPQDPLVAQLRQVRAPPGILHRCDPWTASARIRIHLVLLQVLWLRDLVSLLRCWKHHSENQECLHCAQRHRYPPLRRPHLHYLPGVHV